MPNSCCATGAATAIRGGPGEVLELAMIGGIVVAKLTLTRRHNNPYS